MVFITFDTYEHIEKLKQAGLAEQQAKAIVDVMKTAHLDLPTVRDLEALEQKLSAKIDATAASLDAKIDAVAASLDTKIDRSMATLDAKIDATAAALELKMATFKTDIIRWVLGLFVAQSGLVFAMLKFVR